MWSQKFKNNLLFFAFAFGLLFFPAGGPPCFAQSTSQNFPTPVTTNEISGTIKARDLGDARLTTYFYAFTANQGDVFINVVTKNFDGDIDIFTADTSKPLTKIVIYSDTSDNETGRVIYLRQTQKLILRIEGRTPNDEPASFRIKFAGSFQPLTGVAESEEPKLPEIKTDPNSDIKVNSVGTIVEVKPKPSPKKSEETKSESTKPEAEKTAEKTAEKSERTDDKIEKDPEKTETTVIEKNDEPAKTDEKPSEKSETKPEVIITDNLPETKENKTPETTENKPKKAVKTKQPKPKTVKPKPTPKPEETAPVPNPLENIRLIVLFKDGTKIERPMSDVLKVSVDKGILTIINKDGSVGRYSILDVAKMTIE